MTPEKAKTRKLATHSIQPAVPHSKKEPNNLSLLIHGPTHLGGIVEIEGFETAAKVPFLQEAMMDADDGYKGTRCIWPTIIFGVCLVALVVVVVFAVSVLR